MKIQLQTSKALPLLAPFLLGQKRGKDIITRSVLVVPKEGLVWVYSTDGVAHLRARLPASLEGETSPFVVHLESLHSTLQSGADSTSLTMQDDGLWGEFYGGRLHLQTFDFNPKIFRAKALQKGVEMEVSKDGFLRALSSLHRVVESSDIPDLHYLFLTPQGAFASNGTLIARVEGEFPEVTLRLRDSKMLEGVLGTHDGSTFWLKVGGSQARVRTDFLDYVFPAIAHRLPAPYKALPGRSDESFSVSTAFLKKSMRLLQDIPSSSGVVFIDFGDSLTVEVRSRKGHLSSFVLSKSREGTPPDVKVQTLLKTLLLATSVFQRGDEIKVGTRIDGSLLMWAEDVALNFTTKPGMR